MLGSYIDPELTRWFCPDGLFIQVDKLDGEVFREVDRRRTIKVSLGSKSYFAKIHYGVGWVEIIKNLLMCRLPVLGARNEWIAIKALQLAGVPTMEAALFCESGINPAKRKSAIVTRSLESRISLEDYQAKDFQIKRLLIDMVANITKGMHEAGINHRDYYLCHFLLDDQFDEPCLNLIDLHRAQLRTAVPRRWLIKDLGGLLFSALEKDITKRDLLRFVKKYKGELMSLKTDKVFWRKVIIRARKLYVRNHDSIPAKIQRLLELS